MILGASRGFGLALCHHLLKDGIKVIAPTRKPVGVRRLIELSQDFKDQLFIVEGDLNDHPFLTEGANHPPQLLVDALYYCLGMYGPTPNMPASAYPSLCQKLFYFPFRVHQEKASLLKEGGQLFFVKNRSLPLPLPLAKARDALWQSFEEPVISVDFDPHSEETELFDYCSPYQSFFNPESQGR